MSLSVPSAASIGKNRLLRRGLIGQRRDDPSSQGRKSLRGNVRDSASRDCSGAKRATHVLDNPTLPLGERGDGGDLAFQRQ